jgi:hypothetical protein
MRWFRFYHEALDDPKVQRLPAELFKAWVNLLCVAGKNEGHIPDNLTDLAFTMRMSEPKLNAQIEALVTAGLIDRGDTLQPHNWSERQYESDNVATRVKRHRERKAAVTSNVPCNVTETEPVTVPDTDTDTDTEQRRKKAALRAEFVRFWKAYPRKEAKGDAEKAFTPACKIADPDTIIAKCLAFQWPEDRRFIPLPATWLRARRWEDELPAAAVVTPEDPDNKWRARLRGYKPGGYWPDVWGSRPGEPGCVAPQALLREFGL